MDLDHAPTRTKAVKAALCKAGVESFKVESWECVTFVHPATKGGDLTGVLAVLDGLSTDEYGAARDHSGMFATFGPTWALPI